MITRAYTVLDLLRWREEALACGNVEEAEELLQGMREFLRPAKGQLKKMEQRAWRARYDAERYSRKRQRKAKGSPDEPG